MLFLETLKIHRTSNLMQSVQASLKNNHRKGAFCELEETPPSDVKEQRLQLKIL